MRFLILIVDMECLVLAHISTSSSLCNNSDSSSDLKNYSTLYDYLTGTGAHNFTESVTIGFVGAYGEAPVDLGALPLAVDEVNANKGKKCFISVCV